MKRNTIALLTTAIFLFTSLSMAYAVPLSVDPTTLSGDPLTTITFDDLVNNQTISTQYNSLGVSFFGGPVSTDQQYALTHMPIDTGLTAQIAITTQITFAETTNNLAFTWAGQQMGTDSLSVSVKSGGSDFQHVADYQVDPTSMYFQEFTNGYKIGSEYIGIFDPDGFDTIQLSMTGTSNQWGWIDDL